MIFSINQLSIELKVLSNAHYQLNSFFFGSFLDAIQDRTLKYPLMSVDYQSGQLKASGNSLNLFIVIADKQYKDNSNLIDVISDTMQVARDLYNVFTKSSHWQQILRVDSANINKFIEKGSDFCAGHILNLGVTLRDTNGICGLPIENYDLAAPIQGSTIVINTTDKYFVFEQLTLSTTWVVNHNLNKHCVVLVTDETGEPIEVDVDYTNNNQVIINLNIAGKGFVYCN